MSTHRNRSLIAVLSVLICGLAGAAGLLSPAAAQETADSAAEPVRPAPVRTLEGTGDVRAELYFSTLVPGQVGLVRLTGPVAEARALFLGREYDFLPGDDGWYALLVAHIDSQPREYPLSILARPADAGDEAASLAFDTRVTVEPSGFIRQNFALSGARTYLAEPPIERREFARLDALTASQRPQRLWDDAGFQFPIEAEFTSAFGQYRILNETVQTRHTGWDQRAVTGTPVGAVAAGEVVFADRLDIRGNYVMIDHGWGVYSGYAHLSQINVERGQTVQAGQIIGASGNTGRSNGPHLHWEMVVGGEWVDCRAFVEMWLP